MGAHLARRYVTETDTEPDPTKRYEFGPHVGFPPDRGVREEREMVATQEQMSLARLPVEQRDYCAHRLLTLMKCKRDNWPAVLLDACRRQRHAWDLCQHQDYVMRMKEYERERRLRLRRKRMEAREEAEAA